MSHAIIDPIRGIMARVRRDEEPDPWSGGEASRLPFAGMTLTT